MEMMNWVMLLALVLLIPGLLFLFIVVFYVAFIGRASEPPSTPPRICPKCGQSLLPNQLECPTCLAASAPTPASTDGTG